MPVSPQHAKFYQNGWKWGTPLILLGTCLIYLGVSQQLWEPDPGSWGIGLEVYVGWMFICGGLFGVAGWQMLRGEDLDRAAAADVRGRAMGTAKGLWRR